MKSTNSNSPHACRMGLGCWLPGLLLSSLLATSCASVPELPWAPVARDDKAGFYETARLEYRLDAGKLGQPLDVLCVDGRQVKYEQIASSPIPDRSVGTLVIQRPHPAGREGYARVTFSIDSAEPAKDSSTWNKLKQESPAPQIGHHEEVHEIWAMDVPAAEADQCFTMLSKQNFYAAAEPSIAPARVTVTLDGKKVDKQWESLPQLNALAQRVRSQGRLVAYLRPEAFGGQQPDTIASVQAYRDLLAKTGTQAGPAAGITAPQQSVASRPQPYASR